jgi:hypothetical protein
MKITRPAKAPGRCEGFPASESFGFPGRANHLLWVLARRRFLLLAAAAATILLCAPPPALAETSQEHVHRMSHHVMPFEMSKTIHIFKMTEFGGVMRVIARDPDDADQLALIRQHLKHEAQRFKTGDYADPAKLHGADMPGLAELQANPSAVAVFYKALPAGAQLSFETKDLRMLTAIHRWFGAQLSEHGADARAE